MKDHLALLRNACGIDVANMTSEELKVRIIEALNQTDDGSRPQPSVNQSADLALNPSLDMMITQAAAMRAVDFFENNNLSMAPEFCASFQEVTRSLSIELSEKSVTDPVPHDKLVRMIGDEVFKSIPHELLTIAKVVLTCVSDEDRLAFWHSRPA